MKKRCFLIAVCLLLLPLMIVPLSAGESEKSLSLEKTTFEYGEDILVTATGSGTDWVGLYGRGEVPGGGPGSICWYYVAQDAEPGEPVNIKETRSNNRAEYAGFPAGEYTVFLLLNDGYTVAESVDITILPSEEEEAAKKAYEENTSRKPDAPCAVVPDFPKAAEGLAEGTVTVELAEDSPWADDLYLYWGTADGAKPLEGYTYLARAHSGGQKTVISLPENLTIPEGAETVLACAKNRKGTSDYACAALPEDHGTIRPGELRLAFQVVSDLHVNADPNHEYTRHFGMMLKDVTAVCPESAGIMAVGDIADHGAKEEYERVAAILDSVPGHPELYRVIGNHDASGGSSFRTQMELFNKYSGNESTYFDTWIGGYHFLFLAGEQAGCPVSLPQKELDWLEEKLAENASPDRPIFLFCHESVKDTVAGSTAEEGWWGISNGAKLAAILSAYPQAVLFNGHSHWELSSKNEMSPANASMCHAFNTSSVGYLWTGYNVVPGEYLFGSEGLFVEVYDNLTLVKGRDFENGLWTASAQYAVFGEGYDPASAHADPAQTADPAETAESASADAPSGETETQETGCGAVLPCRMLLPLILTACAAVRRKKETKPEKS